MGIKKQKADKGKNISATDDLTFPRASFNYPIFCLRHIQKGWDLDSCETDDKLAFVERLCKLATIDWPTIYTSDRHGFGTEKIARKAIKPGIPPIVTEDIDLIAFRFSGKKPMVGFKSHFIFHVIYLDSKFELYNH